MFLFVLTVLKEALFQPQKQIILLELLLSTAAAAATSVPSTSAASVSSKSTKKKANTRARAGHYATTNPTFYY